MYKIILSFIFLLSLAIPVISQNIKVAGIASKGGRNVRTSAQTQYTLMETYPLSTITVYQTGTLTLASIFSDEIGTAKANPFTANSDASWFFYIAAGRYDIKFSGTGIISPFTLSDVFVQSSSGGGGGAVTTVFGRSGDVVYQVGDVPFTGLNFSGSSLSQIEIRNAGDLSSGTLSDARFPATLPAISGINLTNINATNITSGTLDDARLSTNVPLKNAVNIFSLQNIFQTSVGVGTSSPDRKLDVLDASNPQFRLSAVDNTVYTDFFVDSGGTLNILPTGNVAFDSTGNQVNPLNNFDQNLGQINKKWLSIHAAELFVETLVAQNTIATIGGRIIVAPTNILIADLAPGGTSINVKYNNLNLGDRLYMEGNNSVEFFAVTSGATPISGGFTYSVTRNLDGTGANQWFAGDAVVNTGVSGNGFIDIYSVRGVKSATQAGPTIVGNIRNSSTFNDWSEHWAIGNLDGVYGHTAGVYGAAFGRYANGFNHIDIDDVNGFRIIKDLSTVVGRWAIDGTITIGEVAAGKENIVIGSSALVIRNNTTERIRLNADSSGFLANNLISWDTSGNLTIQDAALKISGASSFFAIGINPPTSPISGTGIFIDNSGLYGLNSNVIQTKIDALTGVILAGAGNSFIDSSGFSVKAASAFSNDRSYKIITSTGALAAAFWLSDNTPTSSDGNIQSYSLSGNSSSMTISADGPIGGLQGVHMRTLQSGTTALWLRLVNTQGFAINNGQDVFSVNQNGNVVLGGGSIGLTDVNGFPYIPIMAGAPTVTPTIKSGMVPMVYDNVNNKLCVYNSAWKCVTLP